MSVLCAILGHSFHRAYYRGDGLFLTLGEPYHDGIGRSHRTIFAQCDRCGIKEKIGVCIDAKTALTQPATSGEGTK